MGHMRSRFFLFCYIFTDIDECRLGLHNCEPDFTRANEPGLFRCDCHPGFVKDGNNCKGESNT